MSTQALPLETRPLSQVERVVDTFVAPSKTFADLLRSASWWLPCVLVLLSAFAYGATALNKVGVSTIAENMLHSMPRVEERVQGDPAQAALVRTSMARQMRAQFYSAPISYLIGGFAIAGMFLITTNFVFGGRATYPQMLAVFWYALLPMIFFYLLIVVLLYANVNVDTFLVSNPVGTNLGYYFNGGPSVITAMLDCVDLFSIWMFVLQGLGMARVGRISTGKGLASAAVWWLLYCGIFKIAPHLLFG